VYNVLVLLNTFFCYASPYQKCIAATISGRGAYCRAPIGCMLAWGPQCMPDGTIENVGGATPGQTKSASRAPASEAGPNLLPGFASRGMEKFAPPGIGIRCPSRPGTPNSFQSNAPQTHSRMSAAAGTSIPLALTVPDRRRRRAIPWPILWRV
jgi:hypothetical protein